MSAGGLLASMIGGAARSGVAMADKISTENRQEVRDKEAYQQDLLASETNHDRQVERDTTQYNRQKERDSVNHQRSITLANVSRSSQERIAANKLAYDAEQKRLDRESKGDWKVEYRTDDNGVKTPGRYNVKENVFEPSDDSSIKESEQNVIVDAEKYAASVVDEMAGWSSSDSEDFKEFSGSRTKALEHYKQEYLNKKQSSNESISPELEEIMRANPSFDLEKAKAYLTHINE
jgi:hypothetical protein